MKSTIRDELEAPDAATFWREIFFDPAQQESIYRELGCYAAKVEHQEGSIEGGLSRRFVFVQPLDTPGPLKKLFGDRQTLTEEGSFDPRTGEYRFTTTPEGMLGSRIRVHGVTRLEVLGAGRIARICELELECRIPGVGGLAERFMAKSNQSIYERRTQIERRLLKEHAKRH